MKVIFHLTLALCLGMAAAECPNACSGHGDCGNYDMCTCWNNWEGNDCSLRTCPFGLAHVDTPKGDLDSSADALDMTSVLSSSNVYPDGTTEQYPEMADSDGTTLDNTAHYYMECSNKGLCDRDKGECECFEGYEGSACQRASCPNACSGHGTCETIRELANDDYGSVYELWDKDITLGCTCDAGYSGADCSSRLCKYGIDPLYVDDDATARVTTWNLAISDDKSTDGTATLSGTYAIKFYDVFGEDYVTEPITVATASTSACTAVVDALEALPNDVVSGVVCSETQLQTSAPTPADNGVNYALTFTGNPGVLKQISVDDYLDGTRSTVSADDGYTIDIYQDGTDGEFTDYFATKCAGVALTTEQTASPVQGKVGKLTGLTTTEKNLLKACLNDSDDWTSNNYDGIIGDGWDYGSGVELVSSAETNVVGSYPHAIKLVDTSPADNYDGGLFYLVWYDDADDAFYTLNKPADDEVNSYYAYVTDGVAQLLIDDSDANGMLSYNASEARVTGRFAQNDNVVYTSFDTSCAFNSSYYGLGTDAGLKNVDPCLSKGDLIFLVDGLWGESTTDYFGDTSTRSTQAAIADNTGVLYEIKNIKVDRLTAASGYNSITGGAATGKEDRFQITLDKNVNWDGSAKADLDGDGRQEGTVQIFKFTPADTGNYEYVSQCSNRGVCNGEDGLCQCFRGYYGDACQSQSALAL